MNTQPTKRNTWHSISLIAVFAVMTLLMITHQFAQASEGHGATFRGVVESKPSAGRIGTWKISGTDFEVDRRTRIEQENGLLAVGSCAKVEFQKSGATNLALSIDKKRPQECGLPGSTVPEREPVPVQDCNDDDDISSHSGKDRDCKVVGRITSLPIFGTEGIWGIDTVSYTVDSNSKLRASGGAFIVDACVKAEYIQSGSDLLIKEMHTTHTFRCDGDVDDEGRHGGEMFGIIESFPLSATGVLTGEWIIGGKNFIADNSTEFNQEKGDFADGVMVKVKFWTDVNDVNYAMKIETKYRPVHEDDDEHGHGSHEGSEGMAAGKVITIPENRIGVWVIGNIEYSADRNTIFDEKRGEIAVDAVVRIRYHLDTNHARIADAIKFLALPGQPSEYEDSHLVGPVEVVPTGGLSVTWQIAGEIFTATVDTRYEEDRGVLAVGAYVRVEYVVVDGANLIVELKTLVAPGAGDNDHFGTIEKNDDDDDDDDALRAASVTATGVWVIGGKSFVITDGTVISTDGGTLNVGDTATVNSYTAPDGTEVATSVQGVTLNNKVYLPTISR